MIPSAQKSLIGFFLKFIFFVTCFLNFASAQSIPQSNFDNNNTPGQSVVGNLHIVGYATVPNGQGRVDIWLNGSFYAPATFGANRSDIPSNPKTGFIIDIDTTTLPNGPLTVEAKSYVLPGNTLFADISENFTVANPVTISALEQPSAGAVVTGNSLTVSGWALTSGGYQGIEVLIDGRSAGSLAYGTVARADVQAANPLFSTLNSGFQGPIDISSLAQGFHEIALATTTNAGFRRVAATSYFNLNQSISAEGLIESPVPGSSVTVGADLPVSGWIAGNWQASQVTVKLNDRVVGQTSAFSNRSDIQASRPQYGYAQGFQLQIPALFVSAGVQKLEVIATDVAGHSVIIDQRQGKPNTITVKNNNHLLGAYLRAANNYTSSIAEATHDLAAPLDIVMYFGAMVLPNNAPQTLVSAYPYLARQIRAQQAIPMLTYETHQQGSNGTAQTQPNFVLDDINAGTYDSDIIAFANEVKAFGATALQTQGGLRPLPGKNNIAGTVLIRLDHEFAANYYSWGGAYLNNSPAKYIAAWRRVVTLFEQQGATNVRWIWAPDYASPPAIPAPANDLENYYPGDGYVDYIGVSGYNWGNDPTYGSGWISATSIFGNFFATIAKYQPRKSLIISEIGSSPSYGSNSQPSWISDAITYLSTNPQIKGIVWFNDYAYSLPSGMDFRVTNTPGLPSPNSQTISTFRSQIGAWRATPTLIPTSN